MTYVCCDSAGLEPDIDRTSGSVAALASLKLYEFEIIEKGDGGKQSAGNAELPLKPTLCAVYPNPFRANLAVRYALPRGCPVALKVYDMSGRVVRTLATGARPTGAHTVAFDGDDSRGQRLPAGVYVVRLEVGTTVDSRRVVLTR